METPFRSSPRIVQPEWIDFNGHLNMAYYSVLFEDPDGIRIEFNHVPGSGLLVDGQDIGGADAFD